MSNFFLWGLRAKTSVWPIFEFGTSVSICKKQKTCYPKQLNILVKGDLPVLQEALVQITPFPERVFKGKYATIYLEMQS